MARTLSAEELASEADVPVERVDWLVAIGVLKPRQPGRFRPGDVFRAKLIAALLRAGFAPEQIEWGVSEGSLNLDNVGRNMLVPPGPRSRRTFAEFVTEDAPRSSLLPTVYKVLGLPEPDPSSRIDIYEEALLEQFLQLRQCEHRVNGERAEGRGVLGIQIVVDELGQVRDVGPLEPLEQVPTAFEGQLAGREPVQSGVLEVIEVPPPGEGTALEGLAADELRVEHRGQGRNGTDFWMYKIRSMRIDAESEGCIGWTTKNDSRR